MNNTGLIRSFLTGLLISGAVFCSTGAYAQSGEVTLNLTRMPVTYQDLRIHSLNFITVFQGLAGFLTKQTEAVKYTELTRIKNVMNRPHSARYFTGLRIFPGLTPGNRIILYYMPVYANAYSKVNVGEELFNLDETTGDLDSALLNTNYPIYYANNDLLFDVRNDNMGFNNALANSERYKRYVKAKLAFTDVAVHSSFFPFQEIDALYRDNAGTGYGSAYIHFTSTTAREDNLVYYHKINVSTLVPSTLINSQPDPPNPFYSMVANLCHTCPPNCAAVAYPIVE